MAAARIVEVPGPPAGVESRPVARCPRCDLGLIRVCWHAESQSDGRVRLRLTYAWHCDWCSLFVDTADPTAPRGGNT